MSKRKRTTIESYNKTAEEYYKIVSSFEILPELEDFMSQVIEKGKILDLGCGPGHHSRIFADNGFDVVGIDLSKEMIAIAKKEVPNVQFEVMDILKLLFSKNTFNGIWASASLLHIDKADFPKALTSLSEVIKDGGVLYISLKEGHGEKVIKDIRYHEVKKFYSYYSEVELKVLLESSGFEILDIRKKAKRKEYDTHPWLHIFAKKTGNYPQ